MSLVSAQALSLRRLSGTSIRFLLNLSLTASTVLGGGTLYRETIQRALAAHIIETIRPTPDWHVGIEDARLRRVLD